VVIRSAKMGRPRQFDEGRVLGEVERQFHDRGYHATTLSDLLAASGLHKGSLYGAFGDKHSLFVLVLRRYADRRMVLMEADFAGAATPIEGIRAYLLRQVREAIVGRGCLVANSALELLPGDGEVEQIVSLQHRRVQDRLAAALDEHWAGSGAEARRDSGSMAGYLFVMIEGLWELGRTASDVVALEGIVEATLRSVS
jgi:TetR/AcrR family transcriptional repressor of nem operon